MGEPSTLERPPRGAGEIHSGQPRLAYRLAEQYEHQLLHVANIGWHYWDGTHWAEDVNDDVAHRYVDIVLRRAYAEAYGSSDEAKQLRKDVDKCQSAAGRRGVLEIAEHLPHLAAVPLDMNANPDLLNCANGTYNLATNELQPHDPLDRISLVTRGSWRPDVEDPVWAAFLAQILPDPEVRSYLQRVTGQGCSGRVLRHMFPVLAGTGNNGKGTFYTALHWALGDYSAVINPAMLMEDDRHPAGENASPEMMALKDVRFCWGSESRKRRKLDPEVMKRLTGGDPITARRLYKDPITFEPSWQLFHITNHLPMVDGDDPAVWRRIRVVPFDVVIPDDQIDVELPHRLKLHADVILAWAVNGWWDVVTNGMRTPPSVLRATSRYQNESDVIGRFINDCCIALPGSEHLRATNAELWSRWEKFAVEEGAPKISQKVFSQALEDRGFPLRRSHGVRWRHGIGLASDEDDPEDRPSDGPTDDVGAQSDASILPFGRGGEPP